MQKTIRRSIALAVAALWSLPASAGDLTSPSVYVAPGGVYIGSAQVYVVPGNGNGNGGQPYAVPGAAYAPPAYAPGYGPPAYAPGYGAPPAAYAPTYAPVPAYRAPPVAVYGAGPTVVPRSYGYAYPAEYAPRPPVAVPYNGGSRCVVAYGRMICD